MATDIDENALENCKKIIRKNELQDNITVITVIEGDILKSIDVKFNISMCNPPFYDSLDKFAPKIHKVSEENTVIRGYAGTHNEMKTPGGELRFIQQYISESVLKRNEVTWFTCLIGIKSHIKTLQHYLKHQFSDIEIKKTTFYQGKTLRWGLAWRFIEN